MKVRHLIALVAYIAALLGFFFAPLLRMAQEENRFRDWEEVALGIMREIRSLSAKKPAQVDPMVWNCAVDLLRQAAHDICFIGDSPSTQELRQLRDDLAPAFRGPADLRSLESIRKRLAMTKPTGQAVTDKLQQSLTECLTSTRRANDWFERHSNDQHQEAPAR